MAQIDVYGTIWMEGFQFSFDAHPPILSRITVANLLVVQTHLGYCPRRCGTSKSAAWQQKPINSLWFCRRSLSKGSVEWKWKNRYLYYNDFTPYSTSILHMMSHNSANMWFVSPLAYFDVMQKNGMCQNRLNRNGLRANGGCNMLQHVLSSLWSKTCSKNNNNLPSSRLFYFSVRPTPPKTSGLRTSIFALRAIYFVSFLICRSIPSVSVVHVTFSFTGFTAHRVHAVTWGGVTVAHATATVIHANRRSTPPRHAVSGIMRSWYRNTMKYCM